ncbi:hypothetical protein [Endozoicomonas arenosclerae]|uniref:hypothetical protein n=1 Tax=Endozoicomonas arenosclerae TaxID=1633495 RepID=UPI000783D4FA|nr:hypothetical protein [Endozoicomonas arenosclerae]
MKQFPEIDPLTVDLDPTLVETLVDDRDSHKTWLVLVNSTHVIIANKTWYERRNKWLKNQIEFPKRGLQWYLDTLRDKFFKTEAEGGLPKGTFNTKAVVDGEELKIRRAFNADGKGGGGYAFVTLDREKKNGFAKKYIFTDKLLFDHGLIQMFQRVADRIARGEL